MLTGDEDLADFRLLEDVAAERDLDRIPELGDIPAMDQEVGGRSHRLHLLDRAHGLLDEARVDVLGVEMVVGDPRELERLRPVGDVEGVEQRKPAEGRRACGGAAQYRLVDEGPAVDPHGAVRPLSGPPQHRVEFTSLSLEGIHRPLLPS